MRVPRTLEDVAREAGVSMKTVSRVVNNERSVATDTRSHVLRVIAEMGYVPHLPAQRLASGRTRSIALHFPLSDPGLISNEVELDFITGIAFGAAEQDYFFSLMTGELTHAGKLLSERTAATYEIFFVLAAFYLVMTSIVTTLVRLYERRVALLV